MTTTSRPSGMRHRDRAGCAAAPSRSRGRRCARWSRDAVVPGASAARARKRPVTDSGCACSCAAVPAATTRPPRTPAPGPRSMMWSARRMVSSSCSTTTSVLPRGGQRGQRVEQHRGCRAGAGRWSARRARSRRPAGSSRVARRAGCAALRRPTASAPRGRAPGSPSRRARGIRGGVEFRPHVARDRRLARRQLQRSKNGARARTGQRGQLGDRACRETAGAARSG